LKHDPKTVFEPLLRKADRPFDLTIVANEYEGSPRVVARTTLYGEEEVSSLTYLGAWPKGIYSLAHVALPFSPDDPVYGGPSAAASGGIQLGNLALRGEHGVLQISGSDLLRLRWNPFFDYVQSRTLRFMHLDEP
jgi:hypothetical protein